MRAFTYASLGKTNAPDFLISDEHFGTCASTVQLTTWRIKEPNQSNYKILRVEQNPTVLQL